MEQTRYDNFADFERDIFLVIQDPARRRLLWRVSSAEESPTVTVDRKRQLQPAAELAEILRFDVKTADTLKYLLKEADDDFIWDFKIRGLIDTAGSFTKSELVNLRQADEETFQSTIRQAAASAKELRPVERQLSGLDHKFEDRIFFEHEVPSGPARAPRLRTDPPPKKKAALLRR